MTCRPGPGLLTAAGVLVALALLTAVVPGVATWGIVPVLLLAIAFALKDYAALRRALGGISVQRMLPTVVGRDRPFSVGLRIASTSPHRWQARIRDVLPDGCVPPLLTTAAELLPRGEPVTLTNELRIPLRGHYEFGSLWIRLRGPFAFLEAQQAYESPADIRVLPEDFVQYAELHKESADELRLLDQIRHSRQQGPGTEFESLSEFREGDDPRRIDWRATARCRRPIVRRFQVERHRDVMILLDCGRLMGSQVGTGTKLDRAVDAALMLGRIALMSGDRCGLGIFDDRILGYLPPQQGSRAVPVLSGSVYAVQSQFRETDFSLMFATLQARQKKRALVIVLSDMLDEETSQRYRMSLAQLAQRHAVLFAALRTPLLNELGSAPVLTMSDAWRSTVAFRILRERERAVRSLQHHGVHVLDVEPSQLTAPLINEYIDMRRRNLV